MGEGTHLKNFGQHNTEPHASGTRTHDEDVNG